MTTPTNPTKQLCFPMFHNLVDTNFGKYQYFRCNLLEEHKRLRKPVLNEKTVETERCWQQCYDWDSLIQHYATYHGLHLVPVRDFCSMCRVIFFDKFQAQLHYAHHMALFQEQDLTYEPATTAKHKPCSDCSKHGDHLSQMVNHLSLNVSFGEHVDFDDKDADQLLSFLEEDEPAEDEEATKSE